MRNVIKKHGLKSMSKLSLLYNPIDYKKFCIARANHNDIVFLYTGSIGQWNKIENYLTFFREFNSRNPQSRIIICTTASKSKIDSIINTSYRSLIDKISVYFNVVIDELPKYYSQCDFGLQLMTKRDSRVGVKYIEYLAAGLTPIVSENVEGAAEISRKYNLGVIISNSDSPDDIFRKIVECKRIDFNSESYRQIQQLSDLNYLEPHLREIYLR